MQRSSGRRSLLPETQRGNDRLRSGLRAGRFSSQVVRFSQHTKTGSKQYSCWADPLGSVRTNRTWAEPRTAVTPTTPPNPASTTTPQLKGGSPAPAPPPQAMLLASSGCWLRPFHPPPPTAAAAPSLLPRCATRRLLRPRTGRKIGEGQQVHRCFQWKENKKKGKRKPPAKQTAILTQPPVGGGGAKLGRATSGGAGVSPRLNKLHTVSLLERQTPVSKHNKAASAFLQFTSIEETEVSLQMNNLLRIGHISVPTSTRRYVNSFALGGHRGRVFFINISQLFLAFLSLATISNRSHHRCRRDTQVLKSGPRFNWARSPLPLAAAGRSPQKSHVETGVMVITGFDKITLFFNTQIQQETELMGRGGGL